jgi:hypothetical protein
MKALWLYRRPSVHDPDFRVLSGWAVIQEESTIADDGDRAHAGSSRVDLA